mmetsp:Transcript_129786/g.361620  ORF Transcript_129786/g.361620 Transcript_129786/m.361620 type:complete len:200 (-) Transcript_129786:1129-1728(-)
MTAALVPEALSDAEVPRVDLGTHILGLGILRPHVGAAAQRGVRGAAQLPLQRLAVVDGSHRIVQVHVLHGRGDGLEGPALRDRGLAWATHRVVKFPGLHHPGALCVRAQPRHAPDPLFEVVVPHDYPLPVLRQQLREEAVPGLHQVRTQVLQADHAGEGLGVFTVLPLGCEDLVAADMHKRSWEEPRNLGKDVLCKLRQ